MKKYRLLLSYIARYKVSYFFAFTATIATNVIAVTIPDYIKEGIETLTAGLENGAGALIPPAAAIVGLALVLMGVRIISRAMFYNSSRAIECDVKNDMLARLMELDRNYYENNPSGAIISRINNDITGVRLLCGFGLLQIVNLVSGLTLAPYKMWLLSPPLTLSCAAAITFVFVTMRIGMRVLYRRIRSQADLLRGLSGYAASVLGAMGVIKNYGMQKWAQKKFRVKNRAWIDETLQISKLRAFLNPVLGNLEHLLKILVLALGGHAVINGRMTLGELTAYLTYIGILTAPLMGLSWLLNMLQQGVVGLASVSTVLDQKPARAFQDKSADRASFNEALEVKNLCFRYPDAAEDALNGISFRLRPGETIGILGSVGSGKTTLVNCLNRYLETEAGQISLDGRDAAEISASEVRELIGTATQEPFLFSDTVTDNVCFLSGVEPSESGLGAVLEKASLTDEVKRFPKGVETVVGEKGIMLSGGQKQRISLARALIRPKPILVLDDVLSAVDYETERRLLASIYSAEGVKSLIIVSHRVKALQRADKILVFEKGKVVDHGTHEELVLRPGYYRDTWELQNALDETAPGDPETER